MLRVFGDFETYYDTEYSLRKMSPVEYILSKEWETLGCAIAVEHEEPIFMPQDEVQPFLKTIKQPYCFISHNALFDACVLAYRYNIHPTALLCTLSMSRALLVHKIPNGRVSLDAVTKFLGLTTKGVFIQQLRGKRYADIKRDPAMLMGMVQYAIGDVQGCRDIFFKLRPEFPAREAMILDRVIRMATQPHLVLDLVRLSDYYEGIKKAREDLLAGVTQERVTFMSNPQFAEVLKHYGVEPPMKKSPANGKQTYAFARTDPEFMDLLEHDDPQVQALVAARLSLKSTIEETRAQRFFKIASAMSFHYIEPLLPVPLKYSGAHTHRLSGDWQLNMQNLSARKSKELRKCIRAPEGFVIVAVDASQIEARLTAWLAGQMDLLQMFADGEDTYRAFAADIFKARDIRDVTKPQRFVGKTCILGLGFGMSNAAPMHKLYLTITTLAREQKVEIEITMEDCDRWVDHYRRKFSDIKQYWWTLGGVIEEMAYGRADGVTIGPCVVEGSTVMLPSGLRLYYHDLKCVDGEYWYKYGQFNKKIYGGKLLENVVQALDRQHVMEAALRTEKRAREAGIHAPIALNVHDENVYCVPREDAVTLASIALEEMKRPCEWADGLPLSAEVKIGENFGELEEWRG